MSGRPASVRLALLGGALLMAACGDGGRGQEGDQATLTGMRAAVERLIGVPSCSDGGDCGYVAFGAKPCGGPWRYVVYSRAASDESELLERVQRYNAFERRMNERHHRVSDCSVPPIPDVRCAAGVCVAD